LNQVIQALNLQIDHKDSEIAAMHALIDQKQAQLDRQNKDSQHVGTQIQLLRRENAGLQTQLNEKSIQI